MATESLKFIMSGVDQTQPAFASVAKNLQDTSTKAQKLTGVFVQITDSLGLDALAAFGSQAQQLSGQLKELSEQGQKAGAGALIAKAGIVAATVAAGFQIGVEIAKWWTNYSEKVAQATQALKDYDKQVNKDIAAGEEQFDLFQRLANAQQDQTTKNEMLKAAIESLQDPITAQTANVAQLRKELEEEQANNFMGDAAEAIKIREDLLRIEEKKLEALTNQSDEFKKQLAGPSKTEETITRLEKEKAATEALRKENEAMNMELEQLSDVPKYWEDIREKQKLAAAGTSQAATAEQKLYAHLKKRLEEERSKDARIEHEKTTDALKARLKATQMGTDAVEALNAAEEDAKRTEELTNMKKFTEEQIKQQVQLERDIKNADKLAEAKKKQAEVDKGFIGGLKEQVLQMSQGAKALEIYKAEMAGLSPEALKTAKSLIEAKFQLEDLQSQRDQLAQGTGPVQAKVMGRFQMATGKNFNVEQTKKLDEQIKKLGEQITTQEAGNRTLTEIKDKLNFQVK